MATAGLVDSHLGENEVLVQSGDGGLGDDTINLLLAAREQEDAIAEAVYEDVLKQISHIKPRIISEGHLNTVRLSEIRGQIECLKNMVDSRQAKAA